MRKVVAAVFAVLCLVTPLAAQQSLKIEKVADGFKVPWAIAFLPEGGALVTERRGTLIHVSADGKRTRLKGVPDVVAGGQGGLLDVIVPRDFEESGEILFSFVKRRFRGAGTVLASAKLSDDRTRLKDVDVIFTMEPRSRGGVHFGSRIVEAPDGHLFLSIGDRGIGDYAQSLKHHHGSIIRVRRDGSVPPDNPFVETDGALPEIWSRGHRNPQGMTLDLEGNLWAVEHGAKGGDELNVIKPGANYGWPVISYGTEYSGAKIGEGTAKPGMEQPEFYWDPSMAPSGLMIYSGKLWPEWRGSVFVGSLKFDYISRLSPDGQQEVEQIKTRETGRVRDVREAPDGSIWFLSEDRGALYKILPVNNNN